MAPALEFNDFETFYFMSRFTITCLKTHIYCANKKHEYNCDWRLKGFEMYNVIHVQYYRTDLEIALT